MDLRSAAFAHVALERHDDVLTVTLDRPERRNAVHGPLHRELASLFSALRGARDLGAVVLTGRGRAFCAGGDATWFRQADPADIDEMLADARSLVHDLLEIPVPVIAAVNGPAVGLGATLALFCDVVFADEDATIADPHVRMGVVAGDGGAVVWPLLMGLRAKRYLMTGDSIDATRAAELGLIDEVVPDGRVVEAAQDLARRFAEGPRLAIAGTKSAVNQLVRHAVAAAFETSLVLERETLRSEDHREAVAAFDEGRPPRFTGR